MSIDNEILLQNRLEDAIYELYEIDELFDEASAQTFKAAGLLTNDAGIVLLLSDGTEYQLTIKQTK